MLYVPDPNFCKNFEGIHKRDIKAALNSIFI